MGRFAASLVVTLGVLTSCASSSLYTAQDLRDVKSIYASLLPVYVNFKSAYERSDWRQMTFNYQQEQVLCTRVDAVDRRDTIDPNSNLFQASAGLDNLCNDIESTYAGWEKLHHRAYDKRVVPTYPENAFKVSVLSLKQMNRYLRRPAALS